jgi:hypothetical protein
MVELFVMILCSSYIFEYLNLYLAIFTSDFPQISETFSTISTLAECTGKKAVFCVYDTNGFILKYGV